MRLAQRGMKIESSRAGAAITGNVVNARIDAWSTDVNETQRGVDWQMKIDDARLKLKSVYPKI